MAKLFIVQSITPFFTSFYNQIANQIGPTVVMGAYSRDSVYDRDRCCARYWADAVICLQRYSDYVRY